MSEPAAVVEEVVALDRLVTEPLHRALPAVIGRLQVLRSVAGRDPGLVRARAGEIVASIERDRLLRRHGGVARLVKDVLQRCDAKISPEFRDPELRVERFERPFHPEKSFELNREMEYAVTAHARLFRISTRTVDRHLDRYVQAMSGFRRGIDRHMALRDHSYRLQQRNYGQIADAYEELKFHAIQMDRTRLAMRRPADSKEFSRHWRYESPLFDFDPHLPDIFVDWLHQPPTLTEPEDEGGWLEEHLSPARLDELFGREWITLTGQSKRSVDRFDDWLRVETCLLTPAGITTWAPRSNLETTSLPWHPLVSELLTYRAGDVSDLYEPGVMPLLVEAHEPMDRDAELGMLAPEPLAPDDFQLDIGELNLHRHGASVGRWRWQGENAIFEVPRNTLTDYVRTSGLQVGLLVTTQRQIRVERGKWDAVQRRTRAYAGSWNGEGVPSLAIVEE